MRNDHFESEQHNRRHFFRTAAVFAASAALPILMHDKAAAAGRHSDPNYCEPVCLLRGSLVQTIDGEIAVEALKQGDLILTDDGSYKPVKWIGRQVFRKAPEAAWLTSIDPVRIARSAISPGVPSRDLFVSPRHSLYLDGYLIPARHLVNGMTIAQGVHKGDVVEYFHVECEAHEVMFVEGCAVETLQLHGSAEGFSNLAERARLFGTDIAAMAPYAPVLGYWNRSDDLKAFLRGVCSNYIDIRDPIQVARDRIADRALATGCA